MSRNNVKITDSDIAHAEAILFGNEVDFGDDKGERKTFIKNLDTIDLQAVPGSGKTTVLLAKLLVLEKHLPFEDGSGILVISHTNTAVDEIENRIGKYCPKLFKYPNFVGTIQSFVDQFLAIPYYIQRFNKRPYRIDDEIYREKTERFAETAIEGFLRQDQNNAKYYLRLKNIVNKYRFDMQDNSLVILDNLNGKALDFKKPKGNTKPENYRDFSVNEKENIKKWLKCFKRQIMIDYGVLHFDDAYFLAKCYLQRYPKIKSLLQSRFHYVFVDEMQDMDEHQYKLLEQLFYDDGNCSSVYQRIGDKNQAIFSGEVKVEETWRNRLNVLSLTGSCRLSPSIAKVVEPFGLPRLPINGGNTTNNDGTENNIPPNVIVFDDDSKEDVILKFCELVKKYKEEGRIPEDHEYPIKAIAWRKGDNNTFGLKSYWSDFEPSATKSKTNYPNLKSYLIFSKRDDLQNKRLKGIHKNIVNALLKLLHLEEITNSENKNRSFTISSYHKYLKEEQLEFFEKLQLEVFLWSRDIYAGKTEEVYKRIKKIVPQFLAIFNKTLDKAAEFVNDEGPDEISDLVETSDTGKARDNIYQCEKTNIKIKVGTVHSVKGETHTATLYLESYYGNDGTKQNPISYESQRLSGQFNGDNISNQVGKRTKQSARMVYVGFSRPTHLLCFAVHKDRFYKKIFENNGWSIVRVDSSVKSSVVYFKS